MALIDLSKKVGIVLEKRKIPKLITQVGLAVDISGSMQALFGVDRNGRYNPSLVGGNTVQETVERILALAMRVDDNGVAEAWAFNSDSHELKPISESNHVGYVNKHILTLKGLWGGTNYAPVMRSMLRHYFGAGGESNKLVRGVDAVKSIFGRIASLVGRPVTEHGTDPVFAIVITDGENTDAAETHDVIQASADKNIYWLFVGIGNESFRFCKSAASKYKNVGFMPIKDLSKIGDEELYMDLINDGFVEWVKNVGGSVN